MSVTIRANLGHRANPGAYQTDHEQDEIEKSARHYEVIAHAGHQPPDPAPSPRDGQPRRTRAAPGAVASLVVSVLRVTRQVTGRFVRALGMICPGVHGGAGRRPLLA